MVVDELHVLGAVLGPHEAKPPLVVHTDGVLASSVIFERLQTVGRRRPEIVQDLGRGEHGELALGDPHEVCGKPLGGISSLADCIQNAGPGNSGSPPQPPSFTSKVSGYDTSCNAPVRSSCTAARATHAVDVRT